MFSTSDQTDVFALDGSNPVQVASLSLPSGQYLIQANVGITNVDSDTQGGRCQLNIDGSRADIDQVLLPPDGVIADEAFLPLMATADLTQAGGTVTVTCATFFGQANEVVLTALQVGGIN